MRKIISFCLFLLVAGCSDMGGGHYRLNNETIGEFFKTGNVMQDKSVDMRADAPKPSGGSGNKSGAHLTGTTLVINRGCMSGTGSWAKNTGRNYVEITFDGDDGLTAFITPKLAGNAFEDCMCISDSYCELTIKNVVRKREKALDGSWFEYYDGVSVEKDAEIIAYIKLK